MKRKGGIFALIGTVLTVAYAIYIVSYFTGTTGLGGAIATAIVTPHMVCAVIAAVFSVVGCLAKARWAMLVASILLFVAGALFPTYFVMVIVQAILCLIAYIRMGKFKE